MNVLKKCGFCQQTGELMCSRCLEIYCSIECQIRDWSDHKRTCAAIPKLCPNESYMSILVNGKAIDPTPSRMLQNNKRSLRPLRKPNLPAGIVEMSVNRNEVLALEDDGTYKEEKTDLKLEDANNKSLKSNTEDKIKQSENEQQILAKTKVQLLKNQKQNKDAGLIQQDVNSSSTLTKPWLLHFPLEKEEDDVIVQYVVPNQSNLVWVILACHEAECDKLLRDIQGQLNPKGEPPEYSHIQVDDIYAAPYDGLYYRVVVLEKVNDEKRLVRVRLIDYGDVLNLPASELRKPLLLMKNLRAFAFQIEIMKLDHQPELCERLRIKVIRSETDKKIVEVVPSNTIEYLLDIISVGEKNGAGGIVAILSSRQALVMLSSQVLKPVMKILCNQLADVAAKFPLVKNPDVGDLVCVDIPNVRWSRGLIISHHSENRLLYMVDNGTIELITENQEIRVLPAEYKQKPRLVIQMNILNTIMNEEDFKRVCYVPDYAFEYERMEFDKTRRTMKAILRDPQNKIDLAEVEFCEFSCSLAQIGIYYWPVVPQDKTVVRVTSVLNVSTVIVCPQDKINIYTDILHTMMSTLQPLSKPPQENDIIVTTDDIMMPYRARVLKLISPNEIEVLDLDNGCVRNATVDKLYSTNDFINYLPVYTIKVHIKDMNMASIKDEVFIYEQLLVFKGEKRALKLIFDGCSYMCGVKLIDVNTNRSLAVILMEQHDKKLREIEEAAKQASEQERSKLAELTVQQNYVQEEIVVNKNVSTKTESNAPGNTSDKLMISDLNIIGLPAEKKDVKLTILDDGDLNRGILTVCEFSNDNIKRYESLVEDVNKHASNVGGSGYKPELDELCVAVFDADKLWYRAVCVQPQPEKDVFVVQFVDFGNIATVKSQFIRKFSKELNFPCVAHCCIVEDSQKVVETLANQQAQLGHIIAKTILPKEEIYLLKF